MNVHAFKMCESLRVPGVRVRECEYVLAFLRARVFPFVRVNEGHSYRPNRCPSSVVSG